MIQSEEVDIRTPVRVSLIKDDLVAGCERIPAVAVVAFETILIVTIHQLYTIAIGVILSLVAFPVLRFLAKRDPQFTNVMIRQAMYQPEYPAQASIGRIAKRPRSLG
jgi:type IV secretory pathway TrbD component